MGTTTGLTLEAHICDQRRSYRVTFATEDQALAFCLARRSTHVVSELVDGPEIPESWSRLYDLLHPTCEHGLSLSNCYGPQHYYFDEEEQARGLRNSGPDYPGNGFFVDFD